MYKQCHWHHVVRIFLQCHCDEYDYGKTGPTSLENGILDKYEIMRKLKRTLSLALRVVTGRSVVKT